MLRKRSGIFVALSLAMTAAGWAQEAGAPAEVSKPRTKEELEAAEKERKKREKELEATVDRIVKERLQSLVNELAEADYVDLEETRDDLRKIYSLPEIDLPIPENIVFSGIGLTPYKAVSAASARRLAFELSVGLDDNGTYQTGIGIEGSLSRLFLGDSFDLQRYNNSYFYRFMNRMTTGFAVTMGVAEEDPAIRAGYGLRLTLWDAGDALLDRSLQGALNEAIETPYTAVTPRKVDEGLEKNRGFLRETRKATGDYQRRFNKKLAEAIAASEARLAFRSSFSLGLDYPTWIARDRRFNKLKDNGGTFWMALNYGFENPGFWGDWLARHAQLVFHLQARWNEDAPDSRFAGRFFERDRYTFATRLRVGWPELIFNLELATFYTRPERRNFRRDRFYRISTGFEYRLRPNIWLESSVGGIGGRDVGENDGFALLNIRIGL